MPFWEMPWTHKYNIMESYSKLDYKLTYWSSYSLPTEATISHFALLKLPPHPVPHGTITLSKRGYHTSIGHLTVKKNQNLF